MPPIGSVGTDREMLLDKVYELCWWPVTHSLVDSSVLHE
jgi:hypothetical protein